MNILVIDYLCNILLSLFSLSSWALLSLMVWLRACSDNRSAYSLWENLAPCSSMDDSISCLRKKVKVKLGDHLPLSSCSQLQNFPTHKEEILRSYKTKIECFHERSFLRLSLTEVGNVTDFADILVIIKTKETSLVKTMHCVGLHAKKMISRLNPGKYTVWYKLSLGFYL